MGCSGCARRRETINRWARLAAERARALMERHGIKTPDQVQPANRPDMDPRRERGPVDDDEVNDGK